MANLHSIMVALAGFLICDRDHIEKTALDALANEHELLNFSRVNEDSAKGGYRGSSLLKHTIPV